MNLREEYQNASDKLDYFTSLSAENKKELYRTLAYGEQKELLATLPFQYLKAFTSSYSKEERKDIYKHLSQNQIQALYNTSNEEEQKEIANILEEIQIDLATKVEENRTNIKNSTNEIAKSERNIKESQEHIVTAKENIKNEQKELKQNKIIIKKLEKERLKKLKKVMKAKEKASLSRKSNRIAIISKYRKNKYLQRIQELELTTQALDTEKLNNEQTKQTIQKLQATIEKETEKISQAEETIKKEQRNINRNISSLDRTEAKIKKLTKEEKQILGKKLYQQKVYERDTIIVRKKHQQNRKQTPSTSQNVNPDTNRDRITPTSATPQNKEPISKIAPDQVDVIDPPTRDTSTQMNNMLNMADLLRGMGVNFYPPANMINNTQTASFMQDPIAQVNRTQMIIASYTMMAFWNMILQQQLQNQQQMMNQEPTGRSRGFINIVNLSLLLSLMLFIFSLVLFFIK